MVHRELLWRLVTRHALGREPVETGTQIFLAGAERMAGGFVAACELLDLAGERGPLLDPGGLRLWVVLRARMFRQLAQRPACLVDFAELAAELGCHQQTQVPGILRWKIFEHGSRLRHVPEQQTVAQDPCAPACNSTKPISEIVTKVANAVRTSP